MGLDYTQTDTVVVRILGTPPGNFGTHRIEVDADSARKFLRGELSAYKVPKHYFFVDSQDDLPFTDTAKIDKKKLTAIMADKVKAGEV